MATTHTAAPDPFLPPDYKPSNGSGQYFRMKEDGTYVIRMLTSPSLGFIGWTKDKKPVRHRTREEFKPGEVVIDKENRISDLWASFIWNEAEGRVQHWECAQISVITGIMALVNNKKWGSPLGYDLAITRTTVNNKTTYAVQANPKEPLSPEAEAAWAELRDHGADPGVVYQGLDPFTLDGNGNGNGAAHKSEPGGSLSHLRRFFALLDEAIKAGVWDKGIKADTEDGRTERRKLLSTLLGVAVDDPKTLTADQWAVACDGVQRIIEKNTPGADDDIPF